MTMAKTVGEELDIQHVDPLVRLDEGESRSSQRGKPMPGTFSEVLGEVSIGSKAQLPHGANVLLVDDLITQGVTAASASDALRDAGAGSVRLMTFATRSTVTHLRDYCD